MGASRVHVSRFGQGSKGRRDSFHGNVVEGSMDKETLALMRYGEAFGTPIYPSLMFSKEVLATLAREALDRGHPLTSEDWAKAEDKYCLPGVLY